MEKIAMINDCAYVGETLIKHFPKDVSIRHIKRTRGLWSKTFGIACKIANTYADYTFFIEASLDGGGCCNFTL
jgi:hypothetical protein